jgi:hypothetical protein
VLERSAWAPFIKERRMKCINATSLRRKSGQWGTQCSLPVQEAGGLTAAHPIQTKKRSLLTVHKVISSFAGHGYRKTV